ATQQLGGSTAYGAFHCGLYHPFAPTAPRTGRAKEKITDLAHQAAVFFRGIDLALGGGLFRDLGFGGALLGCRAGAFFKNLVGRLAVYRFVVLAAEQGRRPYDLAFGVGGRPDTT